MKMFKVVCQCDEECGQEFEVPEGEKISVEKFGDKLISSNCPNKNLDNRSVIRLCEDFITVVGF